MATELEQITEQIKHSVREYARTNNIQDDQLRDIIEQSVNERTKDMYLRLSQRLQIAENIYSSIRGLGILDEIIADEEITEVMINGPDNVFVEKAGKQMKLERTFESREKLEDIIQRIVGKACREVNQSNPIVDT